MEREEAERLVAQYGSAVYRLAYARTGSREDAEDVTQETFLRLVRSSPVFQDGAHEKAWLLRVAAHCAADVFRAPWRKRDLPLEAAAGASVPPPEEPDGSVLSAVLALPEKYRLPVHLFYYEGNTGGRWTGWSCPRTSAPALSRPWWRSRPGNSDGGPRCGC